MISKFSDLYGDDQTQQQRYRQIADGFADFFQNQDPVVYFSAPGRTEVGGNHTDHQRGRVVAAAVNLDIVAAAQMRSDGKIVLKSAEYSKYDQVDLTCLTVQEEEKERSASLIRGICARFQQLGYQIGGFNAYTMSSVLKGSGLSSSAAFEVLVATILNHFYNQDRISPVEIAQIAQYAENVYFGKPSGLLDQTASSVGGFIAIDFQDPKSPIIEKIDLDLEKFGYALCVVDTGGSHADLTGEYAAIPQEMRKVAAYFGKSELRDVDENAFYAQLAELRKSAGDRAVLRAMHFFDDNRNAQEEAQALKQGDMQTFLALVIRSGRSSLSKLQNVFASSNPSEQGLTLALALTEKILDGRGAYRVHGGGFAGTIQAYVPLDLLEEYRAKMEEVFGKGACYVLRVRSAGGTKVELS